jgi:hypothetical protein
MKRERRDPLRFSFVLSLLMSMRVETDNPFKGEGRRAWGEEGDGGRFRIPVEAFGFCVDAAASAAPRRFPVM